MANTFIRTIALVTLLVASGVLHGQYPSKPITLVVPFSAASDADLAARNLAEHAVKYLGNQPIVVVNQPGASGAIGTAAVRNAPADGYTLLLARIASQVILPATDAKTPYRWNDFTLLSVLEVNPYVCAVKADAPSRGRPGKCSAAGCAYILSGGIRSKSSISIVSNKRSNPLSLFSGRSPVGTMTPAPSRNAMIFGRINVSVSGMLRRARVRVVDACAVFPSPEMPGDKYSSF